MTSKRNPPDWKQLGIWGGGLLVIAGLIAVVISGGSSSSTERPDPPAGTEVIPAGSAQHVTGGVDYPAVPPAGGAHDPTPLACGFYDSEVPDENVVHSLEHGVVWVTYRPDISDAELDTLRGIGRQRETIVSPLPEQSSPVIATAWERQIQLSGANDPRLDQFIRAFRDAPSSPEPGASC